ncbi:MAG: hypothetical protein ACI8WB_004207 [Phenylobacterium sp.]|jgi:hypothetical protein
MKHLTTTLWLLITLLCGYNQTSYASGDTSLLIDEQVWLPHEHSIDSPYVIDAQSEFVIKGVNHDSEPRIVVLRFDDHLSIGYRSRLNIERVITPGPFAIHLPLFGLKTEDSRVFDWQKWKQLVLFTDSEAKNVSVDRVEISRVATFSAASKGFDLGSANSPVLRGMTQITPGFNGLQGQYLSARTHVSGNALTTDGIQGISSLDLPVANGSYQVTLWFAIQGEWENLPRQQNQHILVQNKTAWQRDISPVQWLKDDYLAGQYQEAHLDGTPWQLFGDKPQQRVTTTAEVTDGQLHLRFEGATLHDNYLAGVFITPTALQGSDSELLHQSIKERFEQKWQVVNEAMTNTASSQQTTDSEPIVQISPVYFDRHWQPDMTTMPSTTPQAAKKEQKGAIVVSANSTAVLDFAVSTNQPLNDLQLRLRLLDSADKIINLPVEIRQGIWRYQREASSTLLLLSADELQAVYPGKQIRLNPELSRRINLVVSIPEKLKGQTIEGTLTLWNDKATVANSNFTLKVLDLTLPSVRQSIGIYHDKAPHWLWFDSLSHNANRTLQCDYRYLKKLGLTALSPPLSTPTPLSANTVLNSSALHTSLKDYVTDLKEYYRHFDTPAVDYTTVKRFAQFYEGQPAVAHRHLAALSQKLEAKDLAMPKFSIADEVPLLNDSKLSEFSQNIAQLQNAMPGATFLGQLNKPQNEQLVPMIDTAVINYGYGVSKDSIRRLQVQGKSTWLYNMPRMRLAAGFYLWKTQAQGYIQWHGRMPTGAPYDPLDGREADFQMIYPALQACAVTPDINAALLDITEGIIDRQWINWLIKTARTEPRAMQLMKRIKGEIPTEWADIEVLPAQQVHLWRGAITQLAVELESGEMIVK